MPVRGVDVVVGLVCHQVYVPLPQEVHGGPFLLLVGEPVLLDVDSVQETVLRMFPDRVGEVLDNFFSGQLRDDRGDAQIIYRLVKLHYLKI